MPHSNMIQPHFSREAVERASSVAMAAASVSSTSENSSISSRLKSTLDFSKGMAVMAQVPMSVETKEPHERRCRKYYIFKNSNDIMSSFIFAYK